MRRRARIAVFLCGFAAAACNLRGAAPAPPVAATSTAAARPVEPSTPMPTIADRPTLRIHAGDLPVNCRFGPGLVYEVVGGLRAQQTTVAEGRNTDGSWLHVHDPGNPGASCWVAVVAVNTTGDIQSLPVVGAPGASVERIGLRAEPQRITVGCGSFPQYFHISGEISANGPLIVTWQWELSDGERTPVETLVFQEAGTLQVARTESVGGPNDYRIYLHVFDPDEVVAQTAFYANCLP